MSKLNFPELRIHIKEYHYYNGKWPLVSELHEICKEKLGYESGIRAFGRDLYWLQQQRCPIGFIPEEKEYTYKYKGKPKVVKRIVKRVIVR